MQQHATPHGFADISFRFSQVLHALTYGRPAAGAHRASQQRSRSPRGGGVLAHLPRNSTQPYTALMSARPRAVGAEASYGISSAHVD